MEFFCKLGYGKGEVHQVLAKLGQGASENDLLKELIQMGSRPHEPQQYWTQCLHPRPAAHGSCRTSPSFQQSTEETWDPSSNLRPIVIDGSNIAMRQETVCFLLLQWLLYLFSLYNEYNVEYQCCGEHLSAPQEGNRMLPLNPELCGWFHHGALSAVQTSLDIV